MQTRLKRESLDIMGSMCAKGNSTGFEGAKAGELGSREVQKDSGEIFSTQKTSHTIIIPQGENLV
jgi:hypothetical protein